MSFVGMAWRNLTVRRIRTGLTVLSIAMAVAVLYTLLSFNKGYSASLRRQLQQMGVHMLVVPPGCPFEAASLLLKGGQPPAHLPDTVVDEIASIPGVAIAAPGFMSAVVDDIRTEIYYGMDERTIALKNWWRLKPGGRWFDQDERDAVVLGSDAAVVEMVIKDQHSDFTSGYELWSEQLGRPLEIVGVLEPTGTQDDGFFYLPMPVAQELFGRPGEITVVALRLDDAGLAGEVADALEEFEGVEVVTMSELLGSQQRMVDSARMLMASIVLIAIAISGIGVVNTVLVSVFERTREMGVMRATGASRWHVFSLVWLETVLMSAAGGAFGLALAAAGSGALERVAVAALTRVRFLAIGEQARLAAFDPRLVVQTILLVVGIGLAAGVYPAFRASRQEPIEALRTE